MTPEEILKEDFEEMFVDLMRNRMVVSRHKYGSVADAAGKVNNISSLTDRLRKYADTGNTEFLVDAANFAMMEFMYPQHPKAHFEGTDSDASPGRRAMNTGRPDQRGNAEIGKNYVSPMAAFR